MKSSLTGICLCLIADGDLNDETSNKKDISVNSKVKKKHRM